MKIKVFIFLLIVFIAYIFKSFYFKSLDDCLIVTNTTYFNSDTKSSEIAKSILIQNGLITQISSSKSFDNSLYNCQQLDASNNFAIAGLIDSHTHVLAVDKQRVITWKQALELSAARPNMSRILIAKHNVSSLLRSGFTTIRDLGNSGYFLDQKLNELLIQETKQKIDIIYSGPALAIWPTQIDINSHPNEYQLLNNNTDLDSLMRLYKTNGATWIKLYLDNSLAKQTMSKTLAENVIQIAKKHNLKISVHAEFLESQMLALNSSPDSIEHFYDVPTRSIPYENYRNQFVVVTDYNMQACENLKFIPDCKEQFAKLSLRIAWLKANNYPIVFGSDAVLDYSQKFKDRGKNATESLINMTKIGLTNLEAITAATTTPARMLGINAGEIKVNNQADIVLYKNSPIDNILELRRPQMIISNGSIVCKTESECLE